MLALKSHKPAARCAMLPSLADVATRSDRPRSGGSERKSPAAVLEYSGQLEVLAALKVARVNGTPNHDPPLEFRVFPKMITEPAQPHAGR